MSIAIRPETANCFYAYDRERSCGGVVAYGVHEKTPNIETQFPISPVTAKQNPADQVGFGDFLDMVNPLQHLPIISWAYRKITGDTIKPVAAMIGGTLFGGGIGLLTSAVEEALTDRNLREDQGRDVAQNPNSPNPIDRLISKIIGSEKTVVASQPPENTPPLQDVAAAILHYTAFDREQTAGSIAVYG